MDNDNLTIELFGTNIVTHRYEYEEIDDSTPGAGIYVKNNLTFTGAGTLKVSDGDNANNYNSRGIRAGETTIESGAAVNAASGGGQNSYGVNVDTLTVNGELNAISGKAQKSSYGVYTSNGITVSKGGRLNAAGGTAGGTATDGSYGAFIYKVNTNPSIIGAITAKGNTFALGRAAYPTPSINTEAIQYTIEEGYKAVWSPDYDGSNATTVAAGDKTSPSAKYVQVVYFDPATSVSISKTSTALEIGESETLTAALEPENLTYPDLKWESSDPGVATVSESGEVTAVAVGKATITVSATNGTDDTSDDKTATCEVTVKKKPAPTGPVTAPTGKDFTYDGTEKVGVEEGNDYTLIGTPKAVKAGSYTATAKLKEDSIYEYKWEDGTTADKTIAWKIDKAAVKVTAPTGKNFTYDGTEKVGVDAGDGYTLTGTTKAVDAGSYTAKAVLNTDDNYAYTWADGTTADKTITWKIDKPADQGSGTDADQGSGTDADQGSGTDADQGSGTDGGKDPGKDTDKDPGKTAVKVAVPAGKTLTYNGSEQSGVEEGAGYTLTGATATDAGSYTATATLKEDPNNAYEWADGTTEPKAITWSIGKADNPLIVKGKTTKVKYSKLKKKNQPLKVTKVISFIQQGQGSMNYKLVSAKKGKKSFKKYFKISKTTGKVTIKKNKKMKKGTYKVNVKVMAAGNANYNASDWQSVTFKIKVK